MRNFLIVVGCILLFSQCKDENMNYTYVDQNNNRYYISQFSINYKPIKASESSSGVYNGGEDKEVIVSDEDYNEIVSIAENLLIKNNSLNQKREMLTSILFSIDQSDNKRKVILKKSKERSLFEDLLKKALKK